MHALLQVPTIDRCSCTLQVRTTIATTVGIPKGASAAIVTHSKASPLNNAAAPHPIQIASF